MTSVAVQNRITTITVPPRQAASIRAEGLARVLEQGARALLDFAATLTETEWHTALPRDGRTIGVIVHHVATMYPLEIQLAETIAGGGPIAGVSWDDVHAMNAQHAEEHAEVTREEALLLLEQNSAAAASAIRTLTDLQLDSTTTNSLYGDAPLTCQFMLEDHAVRHAWHHLAKIRAGLRRHTFHIHALRQVR